MWADRPSYCLSSLLFSFSFKEHFIYLFVVTKNCFSPQLPIFFFLNYEHWIEEVWKMVLVPISVIFGLLRSGLLAYAFNDLDDNRPSLRATAKFMNRSIFSEPHPLHFFISAHKVWESFYRLFVQLFLTSVSIKNDSKSPLENLLRVLLVKHIRWIAQLLSLVMKLIKAFVYS